MNVFIVDDDDIILFLHDLMIKESGLTTHPLSFKSGAAALHYLDEHSVEGESYLIFLEINMPGMNGWEFVESIQNSSYQVCVSIVMITSSLDQDERKKAEKYSVVIDYLEKPLSVEACRRICRRIKLMANS